MAKFVLVEGAEDKLKEAFRNANVMQKDVAEILGITACVLSGKIRGERSSFSDKEVKMLLDAFPEISKTLFKPYKYGDHVTAKSVAPAASKVAIEVKRISTGYEAQFTGADGKIHSAYGKTEMETRKKAEERMKSITCPEQEKVPDDKASINISGDEAMALLNQLMLDLRNGTVNESDKPVLKSIYLRLAVQII